MTDESRHRVWAFTWVAWLALVAFPTRGPLQQSIGANLSRIMHDPVIATWVTGFVVAGVFVGLGLRERARSG